MAWLENLDPDAEALATAVANVLETATRNAIRERGTALLTLAGGRTPLPAYTLLASRAVQWPHVVMMPTDERCVPHDHAASNFAELRALFAGCEGLQLESLTTPALMLSMTANTSLVSSSTRAGALPKEMSMS